MVGVADRLGDRGDRHRVGQVAAGGHLGQQQVQPDQLLDQRHVGRRQPDPGGDRRPRSARRRCCGRRAGPCRRRAGTRRAAAGRAGPPRGCTPVASAAACTRCRSRVNRCTGLCCGRLRIRAHSGSQPSTSPYRSQVSQVGTSPAPAPSRVTSADRAAGGQGAGSGGQYAASHSQVGAGDRHAGDGGRRGDPQRQRRVGARADRGAGEHQLAVLLDHVAGDRAAHRACRRRRAGGPPGHRSAARQASSRACATVRASPATRRSSASPSSRSSSPATAARSCATSRSTRRPTATCRASRVSSSRRWAARTAGRSASVTPAYAIAAQDARRRAARRGPP